MDLRLSFNDLVKEAASLDRADFEKFMASVHQLRAKKNHPHLSKTESDLLTKINRGFPKEQWFRLQALDSKMEEQDLTAKEYEDLTSLTEAYEKFSVQRIKWLKKLALLRNISIEEVMKQLDIPHGQV